MLSDTLAKGVPASGTLNEGSSPGGAVPCMSEEVSDVRAGHAWQAPRGWAGTPKVVTGRRDGAWHCGTTVPVLAEFSPEQEACRPLRL